MSAGRGVRAFVARRDRGTVRAVLGAGHALAARGVAVGLAVASRGEVASVYLRGSAATGDAWHGLSDLDLVFVTHARGGEQVKARVARRYLALHRRLPLLGRHAVVLRADELSPFAEANPHFAYRVAESRCAWRRLYGLRSMEALGEVPDARFAHGLLDQLRQAWCQMPAYLEPERHDALARLERGHGLSKVAADVCRSALWRATGRRLFGRGAVRDEVARAHCALDARLAVLVAATPGPSAVTDDDAFHVARALVGECRALLGARGGELARALIVERVHHYDGERFVPTGRPVAWVGQEALRDAQGWARGVGTARRAGREPILRADGLLVHLGGLRDGLGNCTVVVDALDRVLAP